MSKQQKISVLGGGTWGTAVALLIARNGYEVILWCKEPEVVHSINTTQVNHFYLPDFKLNSSIRATHDLIEAVSDCSFIFEAVPVKFLRSIIKKIKNHIDKNVIWGILSKGIEHDTLMLPTQLIDDVFGYQAQHAAISGPSFAKELIEKQFTAVALGVSNKALINQVQELLDNDYFKTEPSTDLLGVQMGGAIKNVMALASGIAQGLGYKANTNAFLMTQALKEIAILTKCFGGTQETAYGLSGLGDMILTCTGTLSKNLRAGRFLAQDRSLENLKDHFETLPEGINTVESVYQLIKKCDLDLPLCIATYQFIFEDASFEAFMK